MRALRIVFLLLFFGFSLLPVGRNNLLPLTASGLIGYTPELKDIPLRIDTYLRGEFQAAYEMRFDQELGLREPLVRADNELTLRVFKQIGLNPRKSIVLGKSDYLFEREYVDAFNRHDEVPSAELEAKVRRLALLQQYMESRGSQLLVVISPSKALLYPEYLPDNIVIKARQGVPTNYDKFVTLLERHKVHFFDAQGFLQARKPLVPFTYFGNTGTHWNDPGSCEASAEVMLQISTLLNRPLPLLRCLPYTAGIKQRKRDIDLLQLCNLWDQERLYQPVYHPHPRLMSRGPAAPPATLIVGSSFTFNMDDYYRMYRLPRSIYRYYAIEYVGGKKVPIDRKKLDWEQEVFSKELIIMEINAAVVQNIGWGFLEDAERQINSRKAAP